MLLYIFLVLLFVGLIIFFAQLTVKKKNPEFNPPEVKEEPNLNKLDNLVDSVKKKPDQKEHAQEENNEKNIDKEEKSEVQNEYQNQGQSSESDEKEKNKIGSRGTPPKKPPTINLKEAMKAKQFLDKKY